GFRISDQPELHAWLLHDVLALISPQTVFRLARDIGPALLLSTQKKRKIISDAWRRTWNGPACGPSRRRYPANHARCGNGHPEGPSHGRHESEPRCVPAGCGLHHRCTRKPRNRWSDAHGRPYAVRSWV